MTVEPEEPPGPKVVIVTGTSSGIGLETAIAAASAGWTTVATVRDVDRATVLRDRVAADDVEVDVRRLDVTDPAAVAACVEAVVAEYGRLDALVNNAGSAHVGTVETDGLDEIRASLEVNFFGVVQMTKAAMPHLRASTGRLVTISSVGGVVGQPFNEAYCAAKFAVEGFMEALAPVAEAVGVSVSVIEPGAVSSEFISNAGLDPAAMVANAGAYASVLAGYLDRTMRQFTGAQAASEVAAIVLDQLSTPSPRLRVQTSDWASDFVATKLLDRDGSAVLSMTRGWLG